MRVSSHATRWALAMSLASVVWVVGAQAETTNCTPITTVPFTISAAGAYCLTGDLSAPASTVAGAAITIAHDDVILDLNGFTLSLTGSIASGGQYAVRSEDHARITVKNGIIRSFPNGIFLGFARLSGSHLIEGLRIDVLSRAIDVTGPRNIIRDNFVNSAGAGYAPFEGTITSRGAHARILRNEVVVPNNGICGDGQTGPGGLSVKGPGSMVVGNRLATLNPGSEAFSCPSDGFILLFCDGPSIVARDNTILATGAAGGSFTTTTACENGGGNFRGN